MGLKPSFLDDTCRGSLSVTPASTGNGPFHVVTEMHSTTGPEDKNILTLLFQPQWKLTAWRNSLSCSRSYLDSCCSGILFFLYSRTQLSTTSSFDKLIFWRLQRLQSSIVICGEKTLTDHATKNLNGKVQDLYLQLNKQRTRLEVRVGIYSFSPI